MNSTNIFFSKENNTFIKINRLLKLHSIETYLQYKKKIIEVWEISPFIFVTYKNFKYGIFRNSSCFDEIFPNEIQNLLKISFQNFTQKEYINRNFVAFYDMLNKFIFNNNLHIEIDVSIYCQLRSMHPIQWISYLTQEFQYTNSIDFCVKEWTRVILSYYFCKNHDIR